MKVSKSDAENAQKIGDAMARISAAAPAVATAAEAFERLGKAASKIELPSFPEIRRMKLNRLKQLYGWRRFVMVEFYVWFLFNSSKRIF